MQNQNEQISKIEKSVFEAKLSGCLGRLSKKYFEKKVFRSGIILS